MYIHMYMCLCVFVFKTSNNKYNSNNWRGYKNVKVNFFLVIFFSKQKKNKKYKILRGIKLNKRVK